MTGASVIAQIGECPFEGIKKSPLALPSGYPVK